MPHSQSVHRCLLAALGGAALLLCLLAVAARADPYGQLERFGAAGSGQGQFRFTSGTHALGVDPTDNSVYVGDEPESGRYRIQKFAASGAFLAQTPSFALASGNDGIEGVAIDSAERRIYVLVSAQRGNGLTIAPGQPAAAALYAFSTEPSGEELAPAAGTKEGVLTGASAFVPQSNTPEKALLDPKGIAVDPITHDVIVLGEVGQPPEEEGGEEGEQHTFVALQRVHASGALAERYVDRTGFFAEEATPTSPVVSPDGAVYVAVQQAQLNPLTEQPADEIVQIPSDFASAAPPTPFIQFYIQSAAEEQEGRPLVEFDSNEPARDGDGLSLVPGGHGGAGTIYAKAHIFVRNAGGTGGASYPGALAFDAADGSELGWTGGQTKKSGGESCVIGFSGPTYPSVAGGGEQRVFMLDPRDAQVVEFGPGGSGCPAAEATSPSATVAGKPLSPSEAVSIGTPVTFSTTVTQANALSVEWNFGDGQTEIVSADEYQRIEAKHEFVRGGELTVTETIHTDDLATPTIVKQTKISVSTGAIPPTAVLEGPREVTLWPPGGGGTLDGLSYLEGGGLQSTEARATAEATFDGSASFASTARGPNTIRAYHWVFGDGSSETTSTAVTRHAYEKAGVYTVELTVTDARGSTSEPSALTIGVDEPPPVVENSQAGPQTPASPTVEPAVTAAAHAAAAPPPVPNARLASASLAVSPAGTIALEVTCPTEESSCVGTVTLRTLGAVTVRAAGSHGATKRRRAAVLMLASGTFAVAGGQRRAVTLSLSRSARALLVRARTLHALATLVAHDAAGATYSSRLPVVLRRQTAAHRGGRGRRR